ncbi:hypothetical protein [Erwinia pyrifoliae]|uniref:Uncharacterized protein n=1 Tax=Erwinia pyrifoliae TaxID=79967 RepID=A0ABY5X4F2_ERWPY|nr:hypothetical protein [Erwinia pyrifoliae]AUX72212.1 hypothetical protein CPI84_06825 [Erwinia pyrifoliae]MCA8877548.1 hypothetical protein [Erwinia pyrifoliae]MCT2388463.1 hypothetical protein [Erwinia pyrifoliae]MCU8586632.1 hypothetical protein [Erwinia pyrifoliae]UWS30521.1 hypothetical protein NYP81_03320 [Erwinia pyrifoliae]
MNIDTPEIIKTSLTGPYQPVVREDIADKNNLKSSLKKITSNHHDIMHPQKKEGETSNEEKKFRRLIHPLPAALLLYLSGK